MEYQRTYGFPSKTEDTYHNVQSLLRSAFTSSTFPVDNGDRSHWSDESICWNALLVDTVSPSDDCLVSSAIRSDQVGSTHRLLLELLVQAAVPRAANRDCWGGMFENDATALGEENARASRKIAQATPHRRIDMDIVDRWDKGLNDSTEIGLQSSQETWRRALLNEKASYNGACLSSVYEQLLSSQIWKVEPTRMGVSFAVMKATSYKTSLYRIKVIILSVWIRSDTLRVRLTWRHLIGVVARHSVCMGRFR